MEAELALIADMLLAAGAFGAAIYCYVLAGRLKRFAALESGMGGAIAVLSAQVDDMTRALEAAHGAATGSAANLEGLTRRAEAISGKLELLVASMHDLPQAAPAAPPPETAAFATRRAAAAPEEAPRPRPRFVRSRLGAADLEAAE